MAKEHARSPSLLLGPSDIVSSWVCYGRWVAMFGMVAKKELLRMVHVDLRSIAFR